MSARLTIKPGRVQPLWAGHPWVFAQAVAGYEVSGLARGSAPAPGQVVEAYDPTGKFLGKGFYSPHSAIVLRLLTRDPQADIESVGFWVRALANAVARRRRFGLPGAGDTGYRVVNAEGDDLPGLFLDVFGADEQGLGGTAVFQIGTLGLAQRKETLLTAISEVCKPTRILDRTSKGSAVAEGFELSDRTLTGPPLVFKDRGFSYELPLDLAQKTGFYFDQRLLRDRVEQLAKGRRVLDGYGYVGAIGLAASRGGAAEVLSVDENLRAVEIGAACAARNGQAVTFRREDVRETLEQARGTRRFDLIILDPPKLAPSRNDRDAALKHQTKLVEAALFALDNPGILILSSCSQALGFGELTRALALSARRAERVARVIERLGQGVDHPVHAAVPEGFYLSTVIAEVT